MGHRRRASLALVVALTTFLLAGRPIPDTPPGGSGVRIAIVGQALIKTDPRKHWPQPFAGVRPILQRTDLAVTNFEMAVDDRCGVPSDYQVALGTPPIDERSRPGNTAGPHAVREDVMEFLASMNLRLQSLANNHAWDLGDCGVLATIAAARKHGVTHAGTGNNLDEATRAAIVEVRGLKVALLASTTSRDERDLILPTSSSPGVNGVWIGRQDDWDRNIEAVRSAARQADFVIYYQHFQIDNDDPAEHPSYGHRDVGDVKEWQSRFARAVIDAGATLYIAHGDRVFDGVESYKGRPILRQFGGFTYQGLQAEGAYDPRVWEGLLGLVTVEAGRVRAFEVRPIRLDEGRQAEYGDDIAFREKRGFSDLAAGEQGRRILGRFAELSRRYGARVRVTEDRAWVEGW
jgi:poly-gamma-glutamate capsule biosynthesis protein CapA/YwtB (metallophosphatase superfamily)